MLRTIRDFHEPMRDDFRRGVVNALRFILRLGVVRTIAPIICEKQAMPAELYALVCEYLVEFMPKEKQPEKIKVTPEDGKFSDDEESTETKKEIKKEPKADRSKSPVEQFDQKPTVQPHYGNRLESLEAKYRELVKQIEQYENKIDNFTGISRFHFSITDFYKESLSNLRTLDDDLATQIESVHKLSRESSSTDNDEYYHQLNILFEKVQQMEIGNFVFCLIPLKRL